MCVLWNIHTLTIMEQSAVHIMRNYQMEVTNIKLNPGHVMAVNLILKVLVAKTIITLNVLGFILDALIIMQVSKNLGFLVILRLRLVKDVKFEACNLQQNDARMMPE